MLISLIICTQNRTKELNKTLSSLASVSLSQECSYELLLIEYNCRATSDQSGAERAIAHANLPHAWAVRHQTTSAAGKCEAFNSGLASAQGEILLFADDDVRFPATWIAAMVTPIMTGSADAVGASIRLAPHLNHPWITQWIRDYFGEIKLTAGPMERLIGPILGFRREVLEKVAQFDPELGPGALGFFGETLFGDQLKEAGYRVEAVTEVAEQHISELDLTRVGLLERAQGLGRSLAYICHHWEHQAITPSQLRLRLLNTALRLGIWRRRNRALVAHADRIHPAEMEFVMWYHHYKYYLLERNRPRNYARHGLVKIGS